MIALGACAGRAPAPTDAPAPSPRPPAGATPTPAPSATTSWRFAWSPDVQAFAVRTEADVERTGGGSASGGGAERERVESSAHVSLAVQPAGSGGTRAVVGRVDSLRVRASARVSGGADPAPAPPVGLRGSVSPRGAVRLDVDGTAAAGGCGTPTGASALTALAVAREALPRVPAGTTPLTVGARWRDTVATTTCAGPLPVSVQAIAAYEVERQEGALLRVRRRANSTLRGQGFAGGQSVRVTGTGIADATLLLDPARGVLRGVTGEGRTTMTMTIGTATHAFEQRTRVTVQAR
ncbi:hypothetical protein rosag_10960 [Roseisolibacter agri]|uniref:Uncharacterized protein n=1 Tax=Roseisolibacter agri TaxID=2014610 RepID=A0AA37V9M9_9BACT|nr:hypothetical protein rosag_10960 [Roseisolibacter agri]